MVVHTCNPSIQGAEARGSGLPGQPGLHSEALYQNKKGRKKGKKEGNEGKERKGREGKENQIIGCLGNGMIHCKGTQGIF
jgi:hypothetical protein